MRKITQKAVNAFFSGRSFSEGNTQVSVNAYGAVGMTLHGNLIAIRYPDGKQETEISMAGWPTPTTRERLNGVIDGARDRGLTSVFGVCQRRNCQYLIMSSCFDNFIPFDREWVTLDDY